MSNEKQKYSYLFDYRFLQVIELSIMGAVDGKAFGDIFKSFSTAPNVERLTAEIETPKLAALLDHFIRLFTDGNPKDHERVLQYLHAFFHTGDHRTEEVFTVVDSNGNGIKL